MMTSVIIPILQVNGSNFAQEGRVNHELRKPAWQSLTLTLLRGLHPRCSVHGQVAPACPSLRLSLVQPFLATRRFSYSHGCHGWHSLISHSPFRSLTWILFLSPGSVLATYSVSELTHIPSSASDVCCSSFPCPGPCPLWYELSLCDLSWKWSFSAYGAAVPFLLSTKNFWHQGGIYSSQRSDTIDLSS